MGSGRKGGEKRADPVRFYGGGGGGREGFWAWKERIQLGGLHFFSYKIRGRAKIGEDGSISGEPNFPANVLG
jgi:hypothetical protein